MRPIPAQARAFITKEEGEVLRVYGDRKPKAILKPGDRVDGVLTAGVGHTGGLKIGMTVTKAMSQNWLTADLIEKAAKPIYARLGTIADELTDNQYSALLSWVFNLGPGETGSKERTLWKVLRQRQFDRAPQQMMRFVYWDGQKSEALARRRAREIDLWLTGEPGTIAHAPPSNITRISDTPAVQVETKPIVQSNSFLAQAGTGITAIGAGAAVVKEQIEPYSYMSPVLGKILIVAVLLILGCTAWGLIATHLKRKRANL